MKKILTSLFDPHSTLIIEDNDPAYHSAGQAPVVRPQQHIEALAVPQLSFEKPSAPARSRQEPSSFPRPIFTSVGDQVVANVPAGYAGQVEALPLPALNFDPPGSRKTAPAATRQAPAVNGVEALPLPSMTFEKLRAA